MRPLRFLLDVNLPEPLQKSDRIHAQLEYGKDLGNYSLEVLHQTKYP